MHNHSVDLLILQIYTIFTALAIVTSNAVLLYKLSKKKQKTRTDKIFIILSCSDIGVGSFSIPLISLQLLYVIMVLFMLCFPWFGIFQDPFLTSFLSIIITLDRALILTKAHVYKKYITMKVLNRVIILLLLFTSGMTTFFIIEVNFERNSHVMSYIVASVQLCVIFITIMAHVYLFHYVRSKSLKLANKMTWWN